MRITPTPDGFPAHLFAVQLDEMGQRVRIASTAGSIEGLFAYHVLHEFPHSPATTDVNCAKADWLSENRERLNDYPVVAALGYSLHHFGRGAPAEAWDGFANGLARLRQRDPFPSDRIAFAYQPGTFLGIVLGALASITRGVTAADWLLELLHDPKLGRGSDFHGLLYDYIEHLLTGDAATRRLRDYESAPDLALLDWGVRGGAFRLSDVGDRAELRRLVVETGMRADPHALDAPSAALIWSALSAAMSQSIETSLLSRTHVGDILRRFEPALRRWRWDPAAAAHPIRWPIQSEREVQDVTWLLLRGVFDDLVDEETLAKLGHGSYRADFGIPSLRVLIEVKFARSASDFRELERQIAQDAAAYFTGTGWRYDTLVVFIYDDSASVQEHAVTETALLKLPQVSDVVIASRPSQLSAP